MAVPGAPFGGYTNVPNVISAAAQTAVLAEIDKFLALFPDPQLESHAKNRAHPDFDLVHPATVLKIRSEIAALKTAIDAAPTA